MLIGYEEACEIKGEFIPCYYMTKVERDGIIHRTIKVIFFHTQDQFINWINYVNSKCTGPCSCYKYEAVEVDNNSFTVRQIYIRRISEGLLHYIQDNGFEYIQ